MTAPCMRLNVTAPYLGRFLKKATEEVIGAEFEVIDAKPGEDAPE